jgi:7-keto-8-aminopelargonate synthetase-like enzyme
MDGTIAPLADLCELARRHGAILLVDEAHATGVFGARGSGLVEETGCDDGVHIRVGTLSKALGAAGGFVAGHARLVEWLRHRARAWIFSTAHPPAVAGAAARAIELLGQEPERRRELRAISPCGVYSELLLLSFVETHCRQGVVEVRDSGEVGAGEASARVVAPSGIAEASQLAGLTAGGDQLIRLGW